MHLSLAGQHLKTLPSQLTSIDLTRLRAQGAHSAVWRAKTRYKWMTCGFGTPAIMA